MVEGWAEDQIKLELAAFKAKEAGAVLVAEATNRFIRSFSFDSKTNPDILPNLLEWERFLALVDGAKLATLHHPDLSEKEVRKLQSKRGQKGHRGGRPAGVMTKKRRRELKAPEALKLREDDLSWRQISDSLSVPRSTVRDWIEDAQMRAVEF